MRRTLPAFNIVSATSKPAAMLDSSIKPTDFSIILPFKHNSLVRDLPDGSGQRGVQSCAQRIRGGLSDELASRDPVAGLHFGQAGRAGALFERQQQPTGFEPARPQRRWKIIVMHVEFAREGLDGTWRPSRMACGFTVVGPVHFMFVRRISAFESSQASLGYNSSGQANSVHNPHEQHIAAHCSSTRPSGGECQAAHHLVRLDRVASRNRGQYSVQYRHWSQATCRSWPALCWA